jgi:hypothetical protein
VVCLSAQDKLGGRGPVCAVVFAFVGHPLMAFSPVGLAVAPWLFSGAFVLPGMLELFRTKPHLGFCALSVFAFFLFHGQRRSYVALADGIKSALEEASVPPESFVTRVVAFSKSFFSSWWTAFGVSATNDVDAAAAVSTDSLARFVGILVCSALANPRKVTFGDLTRFDKLAEWLGLKLMGWVSLCTKGRLKHWRWLLMKEALMVAAGLVLLTGSRWQHRSLFHAGPLLLVWVQYEFAAAFFINCSIGFAVCTYCANKVAPASAQAPSKSEDSRVMGLARGIARKVLVAFIWAALQLMATALLFWIIGAGFSWLLLGWHTHSKAALVLGTGFAAVHADWLAPQRGELLKGPAKEFVDFIRADH